MAKAEKVAESKVENKKSEPVLKRYIARREKLPHWLSQGWKESANQTGAGYDQVVIEKLVSE